MSLHGFAWRITHYFNTFFSRNIVTEDLQQNQMFQLRITAVAHISQKVATLSPPLWRLKREQEARRQSNWKAVIGCQRQGTPLYSDDVKIRTNERPGFCFTTRRGRGLLQNISSVWRELSNSL